MRQIIRVTPLEDTAIRFDSIFLAAVNVLCNGMDSQQEKGPGGVCFSLVNIPINDIRFCAGQVYSCSYATGCLKQIEKVLLLVL